MRVTEVRITICSEESRLRAFANVTFDDCFVVRGLKIVEGNEGLFVTMPSRRRPDGTYQDVAHPVTNEARNEIESAVLEAYQSQNTMEDIE